MMTVVLSVKVAVSVLIPASKDMAETVKFALFSGSPGALNGPWIALTTIILNAWRFLTSTTTPIENLLPVPPTEMTVGVRLLFLFLRLPTIVFDVATAVALYYAAIRITSSGNVARLTSLIWFLNPYTTFAVEMLGVPDIAAAFFTVGAFVLMLSKRTAISGVALGAGIALKLYPIFFLPQVLFYAVRNGTRRRSRVLMLTSALIGFFTYYGWALQVGWFALRITAIDYTPVTTPIEAIFDFSPQARISVAAFALIILYFATWSFAKNPRILVSHTILPVLLIYYTFSDPRPQYLVWALPFLAIDVAVIKRRNIIPFIITLVLMFTMGLLLSDGYTTPSGYSLLLFPLGGEGLPLYSQALLSFLRDPVAPTVFFPLVRAALAATTLIYAFEVIRNWFLPTNTSMTHVAQSSD